MRKVVGMINGIGSNGKGRIDLARTDAAQRGAAASVLASSVKSETTAAEDKPTNPATTLAALGAPIDSDKIAAIRSAIAEGRYPVNPKAIAEKMIALDLPLKF